MATVKGKSGFNVLQQQHLKSKHENDPTAFKLSVEGWDSAPKRRQFRCKSWILETQLKALAEEGARCRLCHLLQPRPLCRGASVGMRKRKSISASTAVCVLQSSETIWDCHSALWKMEIYCTRVHYVQISTVLRWEIPTEAASAGYQIHLNFSIT